MAPRGLQNRQKKIVNNNYTKKKHEASPDTLNSPTVFATGLAGGADFAGLPKMFPKIPASFFLGAGLAAGGSGFLTTASTSSTTGSAFLGAALGGIGTTDSLFAWSSCCRAMASLAFWSSFAAASSSKARLFATCAASFSAIALAYMSARFKE